MPREVQLSTDGGFDELSRKRLAGLAGLQYGGNRDVYDVAGYPVDLDFAHFWDRYRRQHIARRVVDMPAKATWRNAPTVTDTPDSEDASEFDQALQTIIRKTQLWHKLERVDRLAGIGEFAVLVIGQKVDDSDLESEMEPMQGPEEIIWLSAFHQGDTQIKDWVTDAGSEHFGTPAVYNIDISENIEGFPESNETVDRSRVLHVADDLVNDEVFGTPRLQTVFNLLIDVEKETAATAEAYWQLADQILAVNISDEFDPQSIDTDALEGDLKDLVHNLRRHFIAQGIDMEFLGGDTPDPSDPIQMAMTLIASAAGIPKGILFGTERGDVAERQDQREWAGRISERQTWFAEPMVLRPLIDRWIEHGALPEPQDGTYDVQWPGLLELTESEKAELNLNRAKTAKALTPAGADPTRLVNIEDDGEVRLMPTEEE